jgi:hypothetical protein
MLGRYWRYPGSLFLDLPPARTVASQTSLTDQRSVFLSNSAWEAQSYSACVAEGNIAAKHVGGHVLNQSMVRIGEAR